MFSRRFWQHLGMYMDACIFIIRFNEHYIVAHKVILWLNLTKIAIISIKCWEFDQHPKVVSILGFSVIVYDVMTVYIIFIDLFIKGIIIFIQKPINHL